MAYCRLWYQPDPFTIIRIIHIVQYNINYFRKFIIQAMTTSILQSSVVREAALRTYWQWEYKSQRDRQLPRHFEDDEVS